MTSRAIRATGPRLPIQTKLARVASASRQSRGAAICGKVEGRLVVVTPGQRKGQPGREAVAGPVGVRERPGQRGGRVRAGALTGDEASALAPARRDHESRLRLDLAGLVGLLGIAPAADERVQLDPRFDE